MSNNNSLLVIELYKCGSLWAFDDSNVGLVREPFVSSTSDLITKVAEDAGCGNNERLWLTFSAMPFPGYTIRLSLIEFGSYGGTTYRCAEYDRDIWLCPALLKYFDEPPKEIYANIH